MAPQIGQWSLANGRWSSLVNGRWPMVASRAYDMELRTLH
jgi:hypothetical protein